MTRDQWAKMWDSIKCIESINRDLYVGSLSHTVETNNKLKKEIKFIKDQIQSEIGQME